MCGRAVDPHACAVERPWPGMFGSKAAEAMGKGKEAAGAGDGRAPQEALCGRARPRRAPGKCGAARAAVTALVNCPVCMRCFTTSVGTRTCRGGLHAPTLTKEGSRGVRLHSQTMGVGGCASIHK